MVAFILDCSGNYFWLRIKVTFINQWNSFQAKVTEIFQAKKLSLLGRGGGASGRATASNMNRLGSNLGMVLGFFWFRIAINLLSMGFLLFPNNK